MRTVTRNVYTAAELQAQFPKAFDRALERYRQAIYDDPPWQSEWQDSLTEALKPFKNRELPCLEHAGIGRTMAWIENNILGPMRIPFTPYFAPGLQPEVGRSRRRLSKYGSFYRPGMIKPCPWTGFVGDEVMLDEIRKCAREGIPLRDFITRLVDECNRAFGEDTESNCTEEAFIEYADANCREFYENGEEVGKPGDLCDDCL